MDNTALTISQHVHWVWERMRLKRDSGLDAVRERADPVILHVALFSQKSLAVRCVSVGHSVDAGERDTLQLDESVTQVLPPQWL